MSLREKRLLLATLGVVLLGLGLWLSRRPASAEAEGAPSSSVIAVDAAAAKSSSATPPGGVAAESPAGAPAAEADAVTYSSSALGKLLEARRSLPPDPLAVDPFGTAESLLAASGQGNPSGPGEALPAVGGVFISAACRGVLLDGEVRFLGDRHGTYLVSEVDGNQVVLERGGRKFMVPLRTDLEGKDKR